jgi:hypothetical protein
MRVSGLLDALLSRGMTTEVIHLLSGCVLCGEGKPNFVTTVKQIQVDGDDPISFR